MTKLRIEDDGSLVDGHGRSYGRLVSIEIEWFKEPSHPLTPTEIRNTTACPFCDAQIGEFCRRWRGGDRKSNHAERVQFAIGQLDSHEILSERSERSGNSEVHPSTDVKGLEENQVKEIASTASEARPTAAQLERESVQRIWDYWIEISGKRQRLDAKRVRHIKSALATVREVHHCELDEAERLVKLALLGLRRNPFHQGQNDRRAQYMEIHHALRGKGDESDDTRIEKAITWAAVYAPDTPSMPEPKVARLLEEIRYTCSLEHQPERDRAVRAWRELNTAGFKIIRLESPPWARLER